MERESLIVVEIALHFRTGTSPLGEMAFTCFRLGGFDIGGSFWVLTEGRLTNSRV